MPLYNFMSCGSGKAFALKVRVHSDLVLGQSKRCQTAMHVTFTVTSCSDMSRGKWLP
jgi:hypothetical protein